MARKSSGNRRKPAPARWLVQAQLGLNEPVVPVCQRSEATEEAWWAERAAELGLTLAEFDQACGLQVERAPGDADP